MAEERIPEFNKEAFVCPYCGTFSAMKWSRLHTVQTSIDFHSARCHCCSEYSIWKEMQEEGSGLNDWVTRMVYPPVSTAPPPSGDLPEKCRGDYLEAMAVERVSPRAACALLRLCIQRLCSELGEPGKNINTDIKALVEKGLPVTVQQALDVVRVVGNNAVHPGEMSIEDDPSRVTALFKLVNIIVDYLITQPREVKEIFEELPEGARDGIRKRDKKV